MKIKHKLETDHSVWCMNFHPHNENILAVGTFKSKIIIFKDGVILREFQDLTSNIQENDLKPVASVQFHQESLLLLFAVRDKIFWYDWENDIVLKQVFTANAVIRFAKFIPESPYLLTATHKVWTNSKLHEPFFSENICHWTLIEALITSINFIIETVEQFSVGNSRSSAYSMGVQYFIKVYYLVLDKIKMEIEYARKEICKEKDLNLTINCLLKRISTIKYVRKQTATIDSIPKVYDQFFEPLNIHSKLMSTLIYEVEQLFLTNIELETDKNFEDLELLYESYAKALRRDVGNLRWPKILYLQFWNVEQEQELNMKDFWYNLITISSYETTKSTTSHMIVVYNPLLHSIGIYHDFKIHISRDVASFINQIHLLNMTL